MNAKRGARFAARRSKQASPSEDASEASERDANRGVRGAKPPARGARFAARRSKQASPSEDASGASERDARIRWIALTGTPGVGKSTLARELARRGFQVVDLKKFCRTHGLLTNRDPIRRSYEVDPAKLRAAWRREYTSGPRAHPRHAPRGHARAYARADAQVNRFAFVEGHLSHLLPVDLVVLLRVEPRALARRLSRRGWPARKVRENAMAEALDVVAGDALEYARRRRARGVQGAEPPAREARFAARARSTPAKTRERSEREGRAQRIVELDATGLRVERLAREVLGIVEGSPKGLKSHRVGAVAWPIEDLPWF